MPRKRSIDADAEPVVVDRPDAVVVTLLTAPARALSPCGRFRASPPVVEAEARGIFVSGAAHVADHHHGGMGELCTSAAP